MPQIPYINIHKHGPGQSGDEVAVKNIFAHDIPQQVGAWKAPLSIGIHPWHLNPGNIDARLALIEKFSGHESVIAIGEIGLDHKTPAPPGLQKEAFIKQLDIAGHVNKPVIIHCVKAYPEIISIVKITRFKGNAIFHGFNQNKQIAGQLLKNGFYLSFGHALLNEKSNASKLFAEIYDNRFFLETDEANIDIKRIFERAAILKNTDVEVVKKIVFDNFNDCFNFKMAI